MNLKEERIRNGNEKNRKRLLENHEKWLDEERGERADLRGADLSGAELNFAKLGMTQIDNCITVGMVGENRRAVLYLYDLDVVYCGCFTGSLKELEKAIEDKYGDDKMGYDIAIKAFKEAREKYLKMIKEEKNE